MCVVLDTCRSELNPNNKAILAFLIMFFRRVVAALSLPITRGSLGFHPKAEDFVGQMLDVLSPR